MCGRFGLHYDWPKTAKFLWDTFQVEMDESQLPLPQYNLAPTQTILILIHDGNKYRVGKARWGFPLGQESSQVVINARSESVFEKPMFRSLVKQRRCLILASGFYEWKRDEKPSKVFWFFNTQSPFLVFAGLYQVARSETLNKNVTAAMLTTAANAIMAPIHDRIPVMLNPDQYRHWVHPKTSIDELPFLFKTENFPSLETYEVSSRVNQVKYNDFQCNSPLKK